MRPFISQQTRFVTPLGQPALRGVCALIVAAAGVLGCAAGKSSQKATGMVSETPTAAIDIATSESWHGGGTRDPFTTLPGLLSLSSDPSSKGSGGPRPLSGVQANYNDPVVKGSRIETGRIEKLVARQQRPTTFSASNSNPTDEDRLVAIVARAIEESRLKHAQPARFDGMVKTAAGSATVDAGLETLPAPVDTVSDVFIDTDIRQAVYSLASQLGLEVVIDDQVRGVVTTSIEAAPFERALRQVLHPLGYVSRQVAGAYYVGVPDPESALFDHLSERYRYTALHRSPEELIAMIPPRRQLFTRPSPTGGWIIVEAPREHAERILQELEELDTPVPQVVLEALICVYSPETSFRFGFDMDAGIRVFDRTTNVAVSGLTLTGLLGDAASANLNNFRVTNSALRLLEQKGYVKIRASPRVMAQDNEKARIHIGRETFFSVQPENSGLLFRQDVQQVASGIMLEITPQIRSPLVTVKIDRAEVSEDIRSDETQANPSDRFPVINRRSVTTTVHVRDGETIVIGGLTQRQKVDQLNRTPGLSRLPLAGKLFQRIEKIDQMVEVAIFISPRIVSPYGCQMKTQGSPELCAPAASQPLSLDDSLAYPATH